MSLIQTVRDGLSVPQIAPEDIDSWRSHVLSAILLVTVVPGAAVAVPGILLAVRAGMWAVAIVDAIALGWVVAIWRVRVLSYRLCAIDGYSQLVLSDNAGKLFKPFQRLQDSSEFEGAGIGHRIVGCHEGRTWAEARKGEGATFFFTLG